MKFLRSNINLVMICSGVLGYIIIIGLFFFEDIFTATHSINTGIEPTNLFYNYHPAYLLLLACAILQGVVWFILIFPATAIISRIKKELGAGYRIWPTLLILLLALFIVIIALKASIFQYLSPPVSPYKHDGVKNMLFIGTALLMGFYFLLGIVMVGRKCLQKMEQKDYNVSDYRRLRSYQDLLLNFTGVILSLGVISSILFHRAFIEAGGEAHQYPPDFSLMFGFLNSLLMLIFYLPNHFIMLDYGRRIVSRKYPLEKENEEIIKENLDNQSNLSKNLKLDLTFTESLKNAILILSPILSGLLPKFFELFGK